MSNDKSDISPEIEEALKHKPQPVSSNGMSSTPEGWIRNHPKDLPTVTDIQKIGMSIFPLCGDYQIIVTPNQMELFYRALHTELMKLLNE